MAVPHNFGEGGPTEIDHILARFMMILYFLSGHMKED